MGSTFPEKIPVMTVWRYLPCVSILRASGLDETDTNSSLVSYHTSGPLSTRFFS